MPAAKPRLPVFLISGSTGHTCYTVLRAALAQFDDPQVNVALRSNARSVAAVGEYVEEAAKAGAVVCHSVVEPEARKALVEGLRQHNVPAADVLGQVVALLEDHLGQAPKLQPGLSYQLRKEYFDRIEAVDFTLAHDDGNGLQDLHLADVVIVGVSRVSKSVTCFYLSYDGVRAANVPLVPGVAPFRQLTDVDSSKVVGLTMNPSRLCSVRQARVGTIKQGPYGDYTDRHAIAAELRAATELMQEHNWRSVDVSYKSVEEVAKEVLSLIGRR